MRFISFGGTYLNCELIESIEEVNRGTDRECMVTMVSGKIHRQSSYESLKRTFLDKVLDSSNGFKSK